MIKQTLTDAEVFAMITEMEAADFGREIEIETVDEDEDEQEWYEDDGQPSEYDEWQDVYGGDDWDHGQYDSEDYFDGGVDF